ncbi:MAG: hypothetical protein ACQERN_06170 [Thermodesulfobacteriota bacterium]
MLNVGLIIAGGVLVIYLVLGPIVLLGVYAFFDRMSEEGPENSKARQATVEEKDPALWNSREVQQYLNNRGRFVGQPPGQMR